MKYPLLTSLFLLWTSASCQSPQEKQGSTDEKLFREYCLMNATETYDFALPGSLTVEDLQGTPVRIDSLAKEDKLILRIRGSFCEDCVLAEIKQINSLKDCSHIAIIATYDNLRMLKIAVEKYGIKVPVYERRRTGVIQSQRQERHPLLVPFTPPNAAMRIHLFPLQTVSGFLRLIL